MNACFGRTPPLQAFSQKDCFPPNSGAFLSSWDLPNLFPISLKSPGSGATHGCKPQAMRVYSLPLVARTRNRAETAGRVENPGPVGR